MLTGAVLLRFDSRSETCRMLMIIDYWCITQHKRNATPSNLVGYIHTYIHTYLYMETDNVHWTLRSGYINNLYSNSNNHLSALQWSKKDSAALRLATQRKSSSRVANPQHVYTNHSHCPYIYTQVSVSHYIHTITVFYVHSRLLLRPRLYIRSGDMIST